MKKLTIEICKISDKKPEDGQVCWVMKHGVRYPTTQVYNSHYKCWDDESGDDYDFEVSIDDIWMPLPRPAEMKG